MELEGGHAALALEEGALGEGEVPLGADVLLETVGASVHHDDLAGALHHLEHEEEVLRVVATPHLEPGLPHHGAAKELGEHEVDEPAHAQRQHEAVDLVALVDAGWRAKLLGEGDVAPVVEVVLDDPLDHDVGVLRRDGLRGHREVVGLRVVLGVGEGHVAPSGEVETAVARRGEAQVGVVVDHADPGVPARCPEGAEHRAVLRRVVDDDELPVVELLRAKGLDRLPHVGLDVEEAHHQ